MKRSFTVTLHLPADVDAETMGWYIKNAVEGWTGGMDPAHPLGCKEIDVSVYYQKDGKSCKIEAPTES